MLSISDSSARKNKLFSGLKALSTSSLSRKCLPLHPKFSLLFSLHCPDADPIKKEEKPQFFQSLVFSPFPPTQYELMYLGCNFMIPPHFQKTLMDTGCYSNSIAFPNKPHTEHLVCCSWQQPRALRLSVLPEGSPCLSHLGQATPEYLLISLLWFRDRWALTRLLWLNIHEHQKSHLNSSSQVQSSR